MSIVVVVGGEGRLGSALTRYMSEHRIKHRSFSHMELDVIERASIVSAMDSIWRSVDCVINCAGILSLQAERHKDLAWRTNVVGAGNLAGVCDYIGIRLVHVSSDYVFGGDEGMRVETDPPDPINYYGLTKAAGEAAVLAASPGRALVLRAPFRYGPPWPYKRVFSDQWMSGRWIHEVVPDILEVSRWNSVTGILHVGGERRNLFEMAKEASPEVEPCVRSDFEEVRVPRDVSLDSSLWRSLVAGEEEQ